MSSFRRAAKSDSAPTLGEATHAAPRGIKPTTSGGLGLVSSGHKELDVLLGGGIALGTATSISVDRGTSFGQTFMAYSASEAISMNHRSLILAPDARTAARLLEALPYNRNIGTTGSSFTTKDPSSSSSPNGAHEGMKNNSTSTSSTSSAAFIPTLPSVFCCSYDLSRPLQTHLLEANPPSVFFPSLPSAITAQALQTLHAGSSSSSFAPAASLTLQAVLDLFLAQIAAFLVQQRGRLVRIYMPRVDLLLLLYGANSTSNSSTEACSMSESEQVACLLQFVLNVKSIIRPSGSSSNSSGAPSNPTNTSSSSPLRATLLLSCLPDTAPGQLPARLAQLCDAAVSIETFAGVEDRVPSEFHAFHGFFSLVKAPRAPGHLLSYAGASLGGLGGGASAGAGAGLGVGLGHRRLGLKRDKRKLHVEPLHLPPEESRAFGSAGTDARLERRAGMGAAATTATATAGVGVGGGIDIGYSSGPLVVSDYAGAGASASASASATAGVSEYRAVSAAAVQSAAAAQTAARQSLAEKLALRRSSMGLGQGVGQGAGMGMSAVESGGVSISSFSARRSPLALGDSSDGLAGTSTSVSVSVGSVSSAGRGRRGGRRARADDGDEDGVGDRSSGPCGLGLGKLDF